MKLLAQIKAYDLSLLESQAKLTDVLSEDFLEDNLDEVWINPKNICTVRGVDKIKYLSKLENPSKWTLVSMNNGERYVTNWDFRNTLA